MAKRKIITINRDLCDGCGRCLKACAEGALALDDQKKAVLIKEIFCDGMGACLGVCPTGALKVEERDSLPYDPKETYRHVLKDRGQLEAARVHGAAKEQAPACGCPGAAPRQIRPKPDANPGEGMPKAPSELSQWPIQWRLVSPAAPYFEDADLLVAADCTAFALGSFHGELLKGRKLIIACPKLDPLDGFSQKISEILDGHNVRSLSVAMMIVPCCAGLLHAVRKGVEMSSKKMSVGKIVVDLDGRVSENG